MNHRLPPERRAWEPNLKGRTLRVGPPDLRPIERTIIVLVMHPAEWWVVDEFIGHTGMSSPVRQQLARRGFEVVQREHRNWPGRVQVWARWTHPVPVDVTWRDR